MKENLKRHSRETVTAGLLLLVALAAGCGIDRLSKEVSPWRRISFTPVSGNGLYVEVHGVRRYSNDRYTPIADIYNALGALTGRDINIRYYQECSENECQW